jgi:hypothetical protein
VWICPQNPAQFYEIVDMHRSCAFGVGTGRDEAVSLFPLSRVRGQYMIRVIRVETVSNWATSSVHALSWPNHDAKNSLNSTPRPPTRHHKDNHSQRRLAEGIRDLIIERDGSRYRL